MVIGCTLRVGCVAGAFAWGHGVRRHEISEINTWKKRIQQPPPLGLCSQQQLNPVKKKEPANLNKIKEYFAQRRFLSVKQLKTKHWRDKLLFKLGQRLVQPGKSNKTELKSLKLGNTRYNSVRFGERRPLNFGRLQAGHRSHGIGIWLIH